MVSQNTLWAMPMDILPSPLIIAQQGGQIVQSPFPLKGSNEIIAFIADPDGYQIELIQKTERINN